MVAFCCSVWTLIFHGFKAFCYAHSQLLRSFIRQSFTLAPLNSSIYFLVVVFIVVLAIVVVVKKRKEKKRKEKCDVSNHTKPYY